jgi:hypothetical protein
MLLNAMFGRALAVCVALIPFAGHAHGQCLSWENGFFYAQPGCTQGMPGGYHDIECAVAFDDGTGPALFVGGDFGHAGAADASFVAKWSGSTWLPLGPGLPGIVRSMAVFDDGSGPALFVAHSQIFYGSFSRVSKWNGTSWTHLPGTFNQNVRSLAVYDDGTGAALYAGGTFTAVDEANCAGVARWTGTSWSQVGGGTFGGGVHALRTWNDGTGTALFAAGSFGQAGGVTVNNIAKWNGSVWSPLGSGISNVTQFGVAVLTDFDDGSGSALYAGGEIYSAGGVVANGVVKWNGSTWTALGNQQTGFGCCPVALTGFDDGTGPALYAGDPYRGLVKRWTGTSWQPVASTLTFQTGSEGGASMLTVYDDGAGPRLYVGGYFEVVGPYQALSIAKLDGGNWHSLRPPTGDGANGNVRTLASFNGPQGTELVAGGEITEAGGFATSAIAKWNGSIWSTLGQGLRTNHTSYIDSGIVYASIVFDGIAGPPVLYAGGAFNLPSDGIATWDGASWSGIGGIDQAPNSFGTVYAFAVDETTSPHALFVGGSFALAGSVSAANVARYDPHAATHWSSVGSGVNSAVNALAMFDDGSGPALYAAGAFTVAGGVSVNHIARWNGTSWSALGSGVDDNALALAVFDDGTGSALYAGGAFTSAGGVSARGVARWNGSSWSAVGAGLTSGSVLALSVYDDGVRPALYASGGFTTSGGAATSSLAKWDGHAWSALGSGVNGPAYALGTFDDGHASSGPELFVGGDFTTAGVNSASHLAAWRRCGAPLDTFCFGDGTIGTCPCGNQGVAGHGCDNSHATGGARMLASGTTQPDTVVLHVSGELPSALSIFLQGSALVSGSVGFGDGLRCVGGSLKRLYVKNASAGSVDAPGAGDPSITSRSAALGDPIAPGTSRYYQTYYRDPNLAFCPAPQGNSWNVTNGVIVAW